MSERRLGKHLIPPLARPQYVALPEGFVSALAWNSLSVDISGLGDGQRTIGLRYRGDPVAKRNIVYRITEPSGEKLESFGEALIQAGMQTDLKPREIGSAVATSILGIRSSNGTFQPASPLTLSTSLLQNMSGIQGAANPPDLAGILETMFSLGSANSNIQSTLSSLWLQAVEERLAFDPLLNAIDRGVAATLFEGEIEKRSPKPVNRDWAGIYESGPFEWLATSWTNLTSTQWVNALPARVWTDWAATVLRMSFGLGFLWEAAWFESLARLLLRDEGLEWDDIQPNMDELMPWYSSASGVQTRDVSSRLKWRAHRSVQIRQLISDWLKLQEGLDDPVSDVLTAMNADSSLKDSLRVALGSRRMTPSGKNLWESIRYSLLTRESKGPFADYYGLWAHRGARFVLPSPGVEWISVMASLSSPTADTTINLGRVTRGLELLGACPDRPDLVSLLEEAGLARGSADADQGVSVATAY